jgi:hypothetical protein
VLPKAEGNSWVTDSLKLLDTHYGEITFSSQLVSTGQQFQGFTVCIQAFSISLLCRLSGTQDWLRIIKKNILKIYPDIP